MRQKGMWWWSALALAAAACGVVQGASVTDRARDAATPSAPGDRPPVSQEIAPSPQGTLLAKLAHEDRLVLVTTGTGGGECVNRRGTIFCVDGEHSASADPDRGCLGFTGLGSCTFISEADLDAAALAAPRAETTRDRSIVQLAGSQIDIECESGRLRGKIYTMEDADGSGCGANLDVDGRVDGGTCTHEGQECASLSCDRGCSNVSRNCKCQFKRDTRSPSASQ